MLPGFGWMSKWSSAEVVSWSQTDSTIWTSASLPPETVEEKTLFGVMSLLSW